MESRFFTKRAVVGAFGAAAMLLAGAAQAALQDRDLDGDTVVDGSTTRIWTSPGCVMPT